jgi:hypothetical protein
MGLTLPALALLVYRTEGLAFFRSKSLLKTALFATLGLSIYIYLPLAAAGAPIINWGDPTSLERFWWHVTGRQYQIFFSPSLETMLRQMGNLFDLTSHQFGPWWFPVTLLIGGMGIFTTFKSDKTIFWFLGLIVITNVPYALNYDIAEDKDAYYLPTFVVLSIAFGLGFHFLLHKYQSSRLPTVSPKVITSALLLLPLLSLLTSLPYNNRRNYYVAEDYVNNILSTIDSNGMLLTIDWQVYSPSLYMTEIAGIRRDLVLIDLQHLRRSWYFAQLNRSYPRLMEEVKSQADAFLEDLYRWEQDPDLFDRDLALNQRINKRYNELIMSMVAAHLKESAVYVTQDLAVAADGQYGDITKAFNQAYQLIPQGLVFQLSSLRRFVEPMEPQFKTRGLTDHTIRFEKNDVVSIKVVPVYVSMAINRGRYFAAYAAHDRAIEAYKQALLFDPASSAAHRLIEESLRASQRTDSSEGLRR